MRPHVSILIPAYNQPDNLRYALQSIEMQTYTDYNIIITDDTRSDVNYEVAKEFGHLPLFYHKNKWVFGSPANWNEALKMANGDYIKFLHHDDWFSQPDSLELFVEALDTHPNLDFAFSASNGCGVDREITYRHRITFDQVIYLNANTLLSSNLIGSPSATIYRRSVDMEFDPNLKWLVDVDFYIRMWNRGKYFEYIDSDLVNCLVSDKSVSHIYQGSIAKRLREQVYLRWKHFGGI